MGLEAENVLLRVAVFSDLHAFKRTGKEPETDPSRLCITDTEDHPTAHPFAGLDALIERAGLSADLVICPGDMTNRADPDGVRYVWTRLHQTASKLGATLVAGTAGNHDLDSRGIARTEDSGEVLKFLDPPFPLPDPAKNNEYWARHVTVYSADSFRLALLNSCARHTQPYDPVETERGSISERTLHYLDKQLGNCDDARINILVCHHHPHFHSELNLGDTDVMRRGQLLIDMLARHGDWLIIHGHKHHPKVSYASGGAGWPTVFAAGSFAGQLSASASSVTRNLFHIVEFVEHPSFKGQLLGSINTWYWSDGVGWKPADSSAMGLPHITGFGCRTHPREIARIIAKAVARSGLKSWNELANNYPEVSFQLPQDYESTKRILEATHKLRVLEAAGVPVQVGAIE